MKLFNKFRIVLAAAFVLTLSFQTFAQEKPDEVLYLDLSRYKPELILPPAPKEDSLERQMEIQTIKNSIAKLDQRQKDLAVRDAKVLSVSIFADVIPGFDMEKLPLTKALFDKVNYNRTQAKDLAKDYFSIKRPYQTDASIIPCQEPVKSDLNRTYPSGHTTFGYAAAVVLANLIPEKANVIMDRARLYGNNRIFCGAHYPSDVAAGEVIGVMVGNDLVHNKKFKTLMKKAKEELAQAGLTSALASKKEPKKE
jgi:acid phosphatase (class A)